MGNTECGYYVMKFMYDIVTSCTEVEDLEKAMTPCRLALEDKVLGNKVMVVDGMAYPLDDSLYQHFRSMKPSHYKVQVDCIYDGHHDDTLPVPTGDGFTNLGGALASFVQWPIHLVIFEENEDSTPRPTKKSKTHISKEVVGSSKEKTKELVVKEKTTELAAKEKATPELASKEKTTPELTAKENSCPKKLKSNLKSKNSKSPKEMVGSCDRKTQESAAKSKKSYLANDTI